MTVTEPSFSKVEVLFFCVEVECCRMLILFSLPAVGFPPRVDGFLIAVGGRVSIKRSGRKYYNSFFILLFVFSYKINFPLTHFNIVVLFFVYRSRSSFCAASGTK